MVNEPTISVTCDKCGDEDDFELTSLAGGGWDARRIGKQLKKANWATPNGLKGETYCENCNEDIS